ncbi:MAG TPA: glycosyltransferase family 2 protein [Patescibacteria group bacterium]|nr:glycosyltransferase family 2 protein [Patescibacteria group bacterium]
MKLSFVIPTYNEAGNVVPLFNEIKDVMASMKHSYEVLFVNDGSRDGTQKKLESLQKDYPETVKAIEFTHNFGKASALSAGFKYATGDTIVTMDADGQDDPHELHKLLDKLNEGYDMVSGWKHNRKDSFVKNNTSKLFNVATNSISKVKLHDFNCGFKVYKADVAKGINLYGELHRYIPVLVAAQGYSVAEVQVEHRKRLNGKTKYGGIRFIHGFLDLITVLFITKFRARPLHLFGYMGLIFFSGGFLIGTYLTIVKVFGHQSIGERPLLLFAVMLMIMGVQVGVMGLVGEQITTILQKNEQSYQVKK